MAQQFIERHKRKSLLALLLLFLRSKRGFGALLLMVMLLMFLFVAPHNLGALLARVPGGGWIASLLGEHNSQDFSELLAAFREAKDRRNASPWELMFHSGTAAGNAAASSVDMVVGSKADLDDASLNVAGKIQGGTSINGIPTKEEAAKQADGVNLADMDGKGGPQGGPNANGNASGGLIASAFGAAFGSLGSGASGTSAFMGQWFFSGHVGPYSADANQAALASTQVPKVGAAGSASSTAYGHSNGAIGWASPIAATKQYGQQKTLGGGCLTGASCAFHQLAVAQANMMTARDPICTPDNGCPPEYAVANVGSSYDGNPIGMNAPNVITTNGAAPQFDGVTTPNVNTPTQADVGQYQQQAQDLESNSDQCNPSTNPQMAQYQQTESGYMNQLSQLGQQANDDGCMSGSCSNQGACTSIENQEKSICTQLNTVEYQRCMACPLTAAQGCNQQYTNCN